MSLVSISPRNCALKFKTVQNIDSCRGRGAVFLAAALLTVGCAGAPSKTGDILPTGVSGFEPVEVTGTVDLKLKGEPKSTDVVEYHHIASSRAYEAGELRQEKSEAIEFTSESTTLKADADRLTQAIRITKKDGTIDLHDFAMPELGESLELTTNTKGKVLKAGDWPTNSIFYVPAVSLPDVPVEVGDTWTMQATWLSLAEMVPYELDMVSILKGFVRCGTGTCADIEVNGNVGMQGALKQALVFRSEWRGRQLFSLEQGTVVWSRVNLEETLASDKVHRTVRSCLEAVLKEPRANSIVSEATKPQCVGFVPPTSERTL